MKKLAAIFCSAVIVLCGCTAQKDVVPTTAPLMSEQLVAVYDKYQFSSTVSTVNLDSGGYYMMENAPNILHQPISSVADYIIASKRIPDTAALTITYAEFNNEIDAKNTFELAQNDILNMLNESGTGYYDGNCVIGFYVPTLGNQDQNCVYYLLYRTGTQIIYVYEQGPVSYVDQNQELVNDVCKTVGFDPSEKFTNVRQSLDE